MVPGLNSAQSFRSQLGLSGSLSETRFQVVALSSPAVVMVGGGILAISRTADTRPGCMATLPIGSLFGCTLGQLSTFASSISSVTRVSGYRQPTWLGRHAT